MSNFKAREQRNQGRNRIAFGNARVKVGACFSNVLRGKGAGWPFPFGGQGHQICQGDMKNLDNNGALLVRNRSRDVN